MAPIFNLHSEDFFWGLNILLGIIVWMMIGYYYARKTYERYFELDVDGFDGFRYRDALLFPIMITNYLSQKEGMSVFIFTKRELVYIPVIMVVWPLKLVSCLFWLFVLAAANSYKGKYVLEDEHPQFPLDL
jgi:hypothetical protein